MKLKSLGLKMSIIIAIMIAVLIAVIIYIVSVQSTELTEALIQKEANAANVALVKQLETLTKEAYSASRIVANSGEVIESILTNQDDALKKALIDLGENVDTVMVVAPDGNVIMRKHSDQRGDNVMSQSIVSTTLSTGVGMTTIAKGATVGLATRGSAVIRDYSGNIIGVVVSGHDLSNSIYVDSVKEMSSCEVTIFDGDTRLATTIIDENGDRVVGTKALDAVKEAVLDKGGHYTLKTDLFGHAYFAYYSPLTIDGSTIGMLFTGVPIDDALSDQRAMMHLVLIIGIICGVICIALVAIFNVFSVSKPLKKIGDFADYIRTGNLGISTSTVPVIDVRSADEVGGLARSLEQAYSQLRGYVGEIQERMNGLAQGDLVTESTYDFQGDFVLIKDSINDITSNLSRIMTEVNSSTVQVSSGAKQIADGAQTLAQGSTQQAASIQELSSSISEIAEKTKTNANTAEKAASLANAIKGKAEKGSLQMNEMMAAVNEINEASSSIGRVIKVIDDIAFQTNILALNAAVEAARAGSAGKGFAVVAEEVRNLAAKSAEAAKDTGSLIENSIEKSTLGVRIAGETADSLAEIVSGINESNQLVGEIAQSSEEQLSSITQVNIGIDQVAQVVQQNSATAQESAAASVEMSGQSDILQRHIAQFRLKDSSTVQGLPPKSTFGSTRPETYNEVKPTFTQSNGDFGKY